MSQVPWFKSINLPHVSHETIFNVNNFLSIWSPKEHTRFVRWGAINTFTGKNHKPAGKTAESVAREVSSWYHRSPRAIQLFYNCTIEIANATILHMNAPFWQRLLLQGELMHGSSDWDKRKWAFTSLLCRERPFHDSWSSLFRFFCGAQRGKLHNLHVGWPTRPFIIK